MGYPLRVRGTEPPSWREGDRRPDEPVVGSNHLMSCGSVANLSIATGASYINKQTGEKVVKTQWHRVVTLQDDLIDMFEKHRDTWGALIRLDICASS